MTPDGLAAGLVDPRDPPARREEKLLAICAALIGRSERVGDGAGAAYDQFQRAVLLEDQVRERTRDLGRALDLLDRSNARLAEANRETERARQDLAQAIETVEEGFALFDPEDRLVLCNARFGAQMPDVRPDLRPGLDFAEYVARVSRSPHLVRPPDVSPEAWAVERMARHREARVMFNVRFAPDLWVQVTEHRMAGGQTVVMQTDVSDIIRGERESQAKILDEQARLSRATLEHLAQGICVADARGRIAGFNRRLATMLSIPLTQLRPGRHADLVVSRLLAGAAFDDGMDAGRLRAWVRAPGGRPPLRFGLDRDDGRRFDVSAEEMPDGGFVLAVADVTAERAAERALIEANDRLEGRVAERTLELEDALAAAERANASRTRFVAAASHDLLQPLSAAKLYLASVADELDRPRHRETVGKAQNALASVQGIIEALLDISRLESGHAGLDTRSVDLGALLAQLRDEFAPAAALKGLRLTVRPSTLRIRTDPTWIRRILQNLIANAVRYTERGGVLVGARLAGGTARIGVWDTGPGIPEEEQENVFREFHRLGRRASASEGLGLGLAIVDRACATLGHPLALDSAPGRGTAFTVAVPLAPRAAPAPAPALREPGPGKGAWRHDGLRVLVVEDDLDMRRALALLLRGWGAEVIEAGGCGEALRLVPDGAEPPHAILADHQLEDGETGIEAVAALRERLGPLPARLVTANRAPEVERLARRSGVEILHKPVDPLLLHLFLSGVRMGGAGP